MTNEGLVAAQRLADLLGRENAALKSLDLTTAVALVADKEAALANLAGAVAGPLPATPLADRLRGLAAENQVLLERAIVVQTQIVRIIARVYTPHRTANRYNGQGRQASSRRAAALTLSTRI